MHMFTSFHLRTVPSAYLSDFLNQRLVNRQLFRARSYHILDKTYGLIENSPSGLHNQTCYWNVLARVRTTIDLDGESMKPDIKWLFSHH